VPAVLFVPTASGDSEWYVARFHDAFARLWCRPSHLTLFRRTPDLREAVLAADVVYVGGGNTKSMLAIWREWGLDPILAGAVDDGVALHFVDGALDRAVTSREGATAWRVERSREGVTEERVDVTALPRHRA